MNDKLIFVLGMITGMALLIGISFLINKTLIKDAVKEDDFTGEH